MRQRAKLVLAIVLGFGLSILVNLPPARAPVVDARAELGAGAAKAAEEGEQASAPDDHDIDHEALLHQALHRAERAEQELRHLREATADNQQQLGLQQQRAALPATDGQREDQQRPQILSEIAAGHHHGHAHVLAPGGHPFAPARPQPLHLDSAPAPETERWDITTEVGRKARRACAQRHLFGAFGLDTLKEYFVQGCNYPALTDFGAWAAGTGCGSEPIDGDLLVHTAWTGPYDHVREDLDALMDSFLMTQDTARAKFIFWLIDTDPDPADPFQKKYAEHGRGAIEFRRADLREFARGTAMEGQAEFLEFDWNAVKKGPRWKANMFRVLILHREGGIWADTDSLFLRDLRPLLEFAGEFASKLTMSLYYNNNVLGLRKGSTLGASFVADMVATPKAPFDSKDYCKYVGNPCYTKWTWNHGLIQLAVRQDRGIVIYPTTYTDPAYACYPQWLLAKSGGQPMRDFSIQEILEFIRGAFVLHTRAYNAEKPINPRSNYGRLYKMAADGAGSQISVPIVATSARTEKEVAQMADLFERRGEPDKIVDPAYIPRGRRENVIIASQMYRGACVNAARYVKGEMYGGLPELQATGNCDAARKGFNETVVFLWHPETGHLRPAHREPGCKYKSPCSVSSRFACHGITVLPGPSTHRDVPPLPPTHRLPFHPSNDLSRHSLRGQLGRGEHEAPKGRLVRVHPEDGVVQRSPTDAAVAV